MAKVISVTNSKGGSGKSTMTVFLASVFSKINKKVLVIDCDEQGSIISAHQTAVDVGDNILFDVANLDANNDDFFDNLENYANKYDYIFIDMPGRGHDNAVKRILYSVEYALIPIGYGDTDIYASQNFITDMINIKKDMKQQGFDLKIGIFFNNLKKTNKAQDTINSFLENYKNEQTIEILKNSKDKVIFMSNREIYKTLEFGHTPLELSKTFKTKNTIIEFEDFIESVLKFLR